MMSKKRVSYNVPHILHVNFIFYFAKTHINLEIDVYWRSQIQSAQGLLAIRRINGGGRSHHQFSIFL